MNKYYGFEFVLRQVDLLLPHKQVYITLFGPVFFTLVTEASLAG